MHLESILASRNTVNALKTRDAAGAFLEIAHAFASASVIPESAVEQVCASFLAREKTGPTSLGYGMAVPHVFHAGVKGVHLVVARSNEGVELGAVDGRPVRVMFCLIACEAERDKYLSALGAVARVARHKDYRRLIERAGAAAQVLDYLMQGDKDPAR